MTWAARYSRTEQPEISIYLNGEFVSATSSNVDHLGVMARRACPHCCEWDKQYPPTESLGYAIYHDEQLRADIAARVPVRECIETDACRNHAVDGERCWEHGGSDPL